MKENTFKSVGERFTKDIEKHTMKVELNEGVFRSLAFSRDGSSFNAFRIVTWPGYLCISGDMGCYVFCRLTDMFQFTWTDPLYCAEKLQHGCRHSDDAWKEFRPEYVKRWIEEERERIGKDFADDESELEDATEQLAEFEQKVSSTDFDSEHEAHAAYVEVYQECEVPDFKEPTHHFLWCLHAINHAIKSYNERKP